MTWEATYEVFGTRTTESGTNLDRQKANTKEEDPTGLLNEGFRYRDLQTGRFISRDPLGFVDGPNVYTYVMQNPWTSFDATGLATTFQDEDTSSSSTELDEFLLMGNSEHNNGGQEDYESSLWKCTVMKTNSSESFLIQLAMPTRAHVEDAYALGELNLPGYGVGEKGSSYDVVSNQTTFEYETFIRPVDPGIKDFSEDSLALSRISGMVRSLWGRGICGLERVGLSALED